MSAHNLKPLLESIQEALNALIMIEEGGELPPDAKALGPMLEISAHKQLITSISNLAAVLDAPPVHAFANEYREIVASIWSPSDTAEEKGIGWGLFNPEAASAQRPMLIKRVTNLLEGFQRAKGQDIFKRPLTTQLLLIDTLFSFFEPHGFGRFDIPLITEQYGDPPLFRRLRGNSNCDPYETSPEVMDIEELLGRYVARNEQITLFADGIRWCATKLDVNEAELRFVVLVHEIAHWMVHRLPTNGADEFPLEQYEESESLFHEALAQLLTHWVSTRVSSSFREVFEKLNIRQSSVYHAYRRFEKTNPAAVIRAIVIARTRDTPSTLSLLEQDIARSEAQPGAPGDAPQAARP